MIPFAGYEHLLSRRFEEAIDVFLAAQRRAGRATRSPAPWPRPTSALGFQTLADQVRRSVRSVRGNQWMFRIGHPADHPLRLRPELLRGAPRPAPFPILRERTPVRMDLRTAAGATSSSSGMDFPEGARVLNVSIDLGVRGRDAGAAAAGRGVLPRDRRAGAAPDQRRPGATADIDSARRGVRLRARLSRPAEGRRDRRRASCRRGSKARRRAWPSCWRSSSGPGCGIEIVSKVNDIPKGSRLAVSTNLLACLIAVCMRATGQATALDRRAAGARAPAGRGAGDPRRVARRLRRRLAGLRRRLAGHQADPRRRRPARATRSSASAAAACCRTHTVLGPRRRVRRDARRSCRTAWCSSTAAWRRTSGRSWRW